jgi:hypothetical protein
MKGQKQSRVDNLEKRIAAMTNVIQQLINEIQHTKTMAVGTYSLVKELPGYDKAIEVLKKKDEEMQQMSEGKAGFEIPNEEKENV